MTIGRRAVQSGFYSDLIVCGCFCCARIRLEWRSRSVPKRLLIFVEGKTMHLKCMPSLILVKVCFSRYSGDGKIYCKGSSNVSLDGFLISHFQVWSLPLPLVSTLLAGDWHPFWLKRPYFVSFFDSVSCFVLPKKYFKSFIPCLELNWAWFSCRRVLTLLPDG